MEKLTKQSMLYTIVDRINELIVEIGNNKEVYESLKPTLKKEVKIVVTSEDIPKEIPILVMGVYNIELHSDSAFANIDIFRNGKTHNFSLNSQRKMIDGLFLSKGDKIIIRESNLEVESDITISIEKNIVEAFVEQYELNKSNIEKASEITEESKKQFEIIKKKIDEFNYSINLEKASDEDLKILLKILE